MSSEIKPDAAAPAAGPRPALARAVLLRLEAAAVIAAAALSILFYARLPGSVPTDDDYRGAAEYLAKNALPGDAVLLSPHWAERARIFITGLPILNLDRAPTREDVAGFRRVFVLAAPALPRSHPGDAFAFLESAKYRRIGDSVALSRRLGLTLFDNTRPETPAFDFTANVADARVYIRRPDGSEESCPRDGVRHPCPRASWINVGEDVKEIAFKPQRCVWAHPAGSEPLVIEYPDVLLSRELRVMGGIVGQIAFRRDHYSTVRLDVKVDGQRIAEMEFPPGVPGEKRRVIDTSQFEGAQHKVQFEVSAPNPDWRHFCFDAGTY